MQDHHNNLQEYACKHMLKFHISLCKAIDGIPHGSGMLAKYSTKNSIMYGIITASHVAFEVFQSLRIIDNKELLLVTKPILGKTVACYTTFEFAYHAASKREFNESYNWIDQKGVSPDIAFIALRSTPPEHDIFKSSAFYDLDKHSSLNKPSRLSGFYRGASSEPEISNNNLLTTTGSYLTGSYDEKYDQKYRLNYLKIPNVNIPANGTSGAAFWAFDLKQNQIYPYFKGILTTQKGDKLYATSESYVRKVLLPELKDL